MNGVSGYLFRVICAAFVCALVGAIGSDGAGKGLRRVMSGLFLSLTVLSPLADAELPPLDTGSIRADARSAVQSGLEQARQAQNTIITESLEAYIWNKAGALGLQPQLRVTLDESGQPVTIELTADAAPLDRQTLTDWICRELGLEKEAVIWNLPHQSSE